ncbi:hypothetical protein OIU83_01375 [Flavobacterium sp. LS1R49]|uniref:Uncharacterized protein n=1 Tax=Flavobacterium shii TaxID=2987687 RepID=A0A9X2ZB32_9FLAO|nr:hypothetical protein [Flavobacterium shii]MCV9926287.1 hypothetical protein [Flavobacterium shii]
MSANRNLENLISLNARHLSLKQQDTFTDSEITTELRKLPLHIYLICRSPKILLDMSNSLITTENIKLNFYTNLNGIRKDIFVSTLNRADQQIKEVDCPYPYNYFHAYSDNKSFHSEGKTNLLFKHFSAQNDVYHDEANLEVLYVGQAFGKNGSRITIDRLQSHEKAQKIYFDTQNKYPDYEIWFLSLTFEPTLMTVFDPRSFYNPDQMHIDLEHQVKIESTPISLDQQITILEAALITYFGTSEFNKEYLGFPSNKHISYKEVYDLDFNSVGFELSTYSIWSKLFSKTVDPNFLHYKKFFLHSDTERKEILQRLEE